MGAPRGSHLQLVLPFLADRVIERIQTEQLGQDFGDRPEDPDIAVVVLVDPEAREAWAAFDDRQLIRDLLAMSHRDQGFRRLVRGGP